jgi:hypothetical protein
MSVTPALRPAAARRREERVGGALWTPPLRARRSLGAAYRRATQGRRALPQILIIGAIKSGTSSLYRWLVQHPQVAPPATGRKELRFFDNSFDRGESWYRSQFPLSSKLERGAYPGTVAGAGCIEATANYLFHPLVPERMASVIPEARLVVLLRNPVDRAISHYAMSVRSGVEDLPLETAIATEAERIAPSLAAATAGEPSHGRLMEYEYHSYVTRGLYAEQLRRWYEHFDRSQVFVQRSEDLFADPESVCRRILSFLGLEPWSGPRFPMRNPDRPAPVEIDLRESLEARFAEPNEELAELVGVRW